MTTKTTTSFLEMVESMEQAKAPGNRTLSLSDDEQAYYQSRLVTLTHAAPLTDIENRTINQDMFEVLQWLPTGFVDILFLDPPYNLTKTFGTRTFRELSTSEYCQWLESWLPLLVHTLKATASVYICGDWRSAAAIQTVAEKHLIIQNRITWEREKGRGSKTNWKNCAEDIWFCTMSKIYTFNADAVKLKRQVIAPYTDVDGQPKDWEATTDGNYRLTYPSNLWTDLTVPFWSMPENTDHPTQKPEKLLAKLILASSQKGDLILDPFLGSGTASVVAKKLGRRYVGIEVDTSYCCLAEKRLALAEIDQRIQGYEDGCFWERNTAQKQTARTKRRRSHG